MGARVFPFVRHYFQIRSVIKQTSGQPTVMKCSALIFLLSVLFISKSLGNNFNSDSSKINELEELVMNKEIFGGNPHMSEKLKELAYAIKLYESIENKSLISDATLKSIGIYYLYSREREKAFTMLTDYLENNPEDGEAVFYTAVVLKLSNKEYCPQLNRARQLGYKPLGAVEWTWYTKYQECE